MAVWVGSRNIYTMNRHNALEIGSRDTSTRSNGPHEMSNLKSTQERQDVGFRIWDIGSRISDFGRQTCTPMIQPWYIISLSTGRVLHTTFRALTFAL